ncbi:putative Ig domain-containing protein [Staphylococcus kloosii]|uniref:putative Ig domain-containing protein n=1 Tax=Staphylococcus kloosii TaxID=29384 RepID=UPI001E4305D3
MTSTDEQGNETTTTFTITVKDTTAPTVNHIDNQTKEVNTSIDPIEIHATDNSGQAVKNTVSGLPEGVTFDPETNTISGTPSKVGNYPVTVTTTDEQGNETTTTFTITVQDTTRPNVESISNQTREVNTAINPIEIHATDNSGQPVKNTVAGLPEGVTFDPETNTISGTPTQVGTSTVTVTSRDEQGNETTTTFTITVQDTTKPTVDSVSDQTKEVNTAIDPIEIHATDNSGQPVKNTVSGLPEGVTFDPETNTISGTPSKVGNYPVTVTSTDEQGNKTTTTFTITVKDTTAPNVESISDQTKEVNTAIDPIEIHATDNSGQPVKNTVLGLPEGVTFNSETNTISGTPSKVGNYPVTVTTTDEQGNETTMTFTITVEDTTKPAVEDISNQTKEVNTAIDPITIHATDNSGQPVKNTVSGLPEGVTFNPETNTISGIPTQVGTSTVTVTSRDEQGNETTTTFTITVKDTTKPTVDSISNQTKEVNTGIDPIEIHATDNSGQPVKNTVSGLPEGVTFDPETNTISGMPSKVGSYPVTVTSTDEQGNETTTTFTITVKDTTAPTVNHIDNQTKEVNTSIDPIEIHATDNSGQPVKNTVSGLPEGVTFDSETNTINGTPTKVGNYPVTVTSTDEEGNETTTTFTITVEDTTKPTVDSISNQTKEVNTAIDPIEIHATDNSGQPVKNSVSGLPEGVTFNPETNTISGTATQVGTSTVTVTSRDEQGNETKTTFTITVQDTTKPTVNSISDQTKEVNTAIDPIEIHATDNSGQPVKNSVSGLPEGVVFNPETNTISGTATQVGTSTVTVTSRDEQGNETTTTFTITVKDTTKPTVDSVSNQTKEVNTSIDPIEIHATDNSGQPVKNAVSGLPEGVTFDSETNTISGTPSKVGNYPVTVTTTDEEGNETTTTFTITVEDTTKPTVDSISNQTKEVNTSIDPIEIHATDNSGQAVKNIVSGLPEGVTFNPETNTISGTPSKVGSYPVTVTSTDEQGNETTTTFTITVKDTTKPTVEDISNQTKEVNTGIDPIEIHATDNSGQPVKNTVSGLPEGVTFNPETNTISGTPTQVGTSTVTVTSRDEQGNETTTTFTITVQDTTAPTVNHIDNQTREVNTAINPIEIHATDNSGQPVKNTVSGLPEGVTFDPETNTISGMPSKVGSYPVTVTSTDEQGNETTTTFTITVKDTTKPAVEDISNQTKEVNTSIDPIEIHATDNSGQPVKNTVSGLPEGVTFDPETNTISGMPSKVGSYPVTVTSTDEQGNETTTTFTITVKDTTAPKVDAIPDQTKHVNTPIDPITIHAIDNSGQPVKNTVAGLPEGVTFNPETNTISGTPTKVGSYPVTVTTTDEQGNKTTTTFTITVKDTTAPKVDAIPDQTKHVNTPIDPITIHATDNSGQPVKNTVSGLPKGVTFDPKTNTISGVPTQVGVYPVTITTVDSQGNETTTTFNITVIDSNQNGIPSDNHPTASHDKDNQGQAPVSSNEENGNIGENKSPITSSPDIDHQQSNNIEETNTQGQYNYSSFEDEKNNKNINYLSQTSKGTKKKENINFNSNSSNKSETPSHVTQENQQDMTKALNRNQVLTDDKKDKVDVLPDTGETDPKNSTLFAGIFAALGSLFILGRRRKKKDEQ